MNDLKHIAAAILLFAVFLAATQSAFAQKRIYIIEGHFFNEVPVDSKMLNGIVQVSKAPDRKVIGVSLSQPLPEEALRYEIPSDSIADADSLLQIFADKQSRMFRFKVAEETLLDTGTPLPAFSATDIDGQTWSNADAKGKVMVINCWFSGCGPCLAEMPELSQWKTEMPDVMFFSSTYEDAATAQRIIRSRGFNWIPLVNDSHFKEYIGGNGYPMTIVVDKEGIIRQIEYSTSLLQRDKLRRTIESLR